MECNKDEALRAQNIAEKKFKDKDIAGAKKFALKAQNLYPPLEGISQMLSTLDVYIAAENRISGDVDWYGVLGVTPTADEETVRKQFRKLALILHPDKNKSVGADGAFKLISEAWSLLSDRVKRLLYNQKRSGIRFQPSAQTQPQRPYAASTSNGVGNSTNSVPSKSTTQRNTMPPPASRRTDTFLTMCSRCKMQYEHTKIYLHTSIRCPNCLEIFQAVQVAPPVNISQSSYSSSKQSNQNLRNPTPISNAGRNNAATQNIGQGRSTGTANSYQHINSAWTAYANMAGTGKVESFVAAKESNVFQPTHCRFKREHEESQGSTVKSEPSSKKRVLDGNDRHYGGNFSFQTPGNSAYTCGKGSVSGLQGSVGVNSKPKSTREMTPLELRKMLMEKALKEICVKLNKWKSDAIDLAGKKKKVEGSKEELKSSATSCAQSNGISESSTTKTDDKTMKSFGDTFANGGDSEDHVALSMNVPDPDFHDFDMDRAEFSFEDNQIWAAYDDDDGMPRYYAFIQKVISRKPFKLRFSWLESKTNTEFGSMEWVSSGFAKSCGEFRTGKYEISKTLNLFSHKVKWTKGARGIIHLVPRKGDIWALYRNWSNDWNEHTPDEVIHKYDMVEVLDDYNEEKGIPVIPLVKVAGFKTVFHRQLQEDKIITIPKEEMFRFSHQVPNYVLTGQEAQNVPKGCQELDPAATPLELLQVINEVEVPAAENANKVISLNATGNSVK